MFSATGSAGRLQSVTGLFWSYQTIKRTLAPVVVLQASAFVKGLHPLNATAHFSQSISTVFLKIIPFAHIWCKFKSVKQQRGLAALRAENLRSNGPKCWAAVGLNDIALASDRME
jgi:hypothetical protein